MVARLLSAAGRVVAHVHCGACAGVAAAPRHCMRLLREARRNQHRRAERGLAGWLFLRGLAHQIHAPHQVDRNPPVGFVQLRSGMLRYPLHSSRTRGCHADADRWRDRRWPAACRYRQEGGVGPNVPTTLIQLPRRLHRPLWCRRRRHWRGRSKCCSRWGMSRPPQRRRLRRCIPSARCLP
jgi:hypothetical protein